jgi:hypothetical protein
MMIYGRKLIEALAPKYEEGIVFIKNGKTYARFDSFTVHSGESAKVVFHYKGEECFTLNCHQRFGDGNTLTVKGIEGTNELFIE